MLFQSIALSWRFKPLRESNISRTRFFNFFGRGLPEHFFISQLKTSLIANVDFDMTEGAQKRDFLHGDDVISALLLAESEKANQQILNVCSGQSHSIREIALSLKLLLQSTSTINFGALPYRENEIWNVIGDPGKIHALLGWRPNLTFEQALEALIDTKANL